MLHNRRNPSQIASSFRRLTTASGLLSIRRGVDVRTDVEPVIFALFIPPAVPVGVLMSDDGTGTNGNPWPASNWETGHNTASATFDIQSNQLRVTASSTTFATNRVLESLITGQGGAFDITFDYTVGNIAVAHGALVTVNGGAGDGDRFEFAHYFNSGTIDVAKVAGFSYSYPGSASVSVAVSDVVHVHLVRDPASGQLDVTVWLNGASEPGSPTISITDTSFPVDRIEFGIYDPSAARTVLYDNVVVSSFGFVGGTDYPVPLAGTVSPSAALIRTTGKPQASSSTPAGALPRSPAKTAAGSTAAAGAAARAASKYFTGSSTVSGSVAVLRVVLRSFAGAVTAAASVVQSVAKRAGGSVTGAGAPARSTAKPLAGSSASSGTAVRVAAKGLSGTSVPTGLVLVLRVILRTFTGAATASAALVRATSKRIVGGSSAAGGVVKAASNRPTGSVSAAGALAKAIAFRPAGSLSAAGGLMRSVAKVVRGVIAGAAELLTTHGTGPTGDPGSLVLSVVGPDVVLVPGPVAEISLSVAAGDVTLRLSAAEVRLAVVGPELSLVAIPEE